MKIKISAFVFAFLLMLAATPCFALMGIEVVSRERAKELGMEIRTNHAGPDGVRIELEFRTDGALKNYLRTDLMTRDGDKWVFVSLREEQSNPGRALVSFAADRSSLDKITLRVVTGGGRDLSGHDLRVKDFVDAQSAR